MGGVGEVEVGERGEDGAGNGDVFTGYVPMIEVSIAR